MVMFSMLWPQELYVLGQNHTSCLKVTCISIGVTPKNWVHVQHNPLIPDMMFQVFGIDIDASDQMYDWIMYALGYGISCAWPTSWQLSHIDLIQFIKCLVLMRLTGQSLMLKIRCMIRCSLLWVKKFYVPGQNQNYASYLKVTFSFKFKTNYPK